MTSSMLWILPAVMLVLFIIRLYLQKNISPPSAIELSVYSAISSIMLVLTQDIRGLIGYDPLHQISEGLRELAIGALFWLVGALLLVGLILGVGVRIFKTVQREKVANALVFLQPVLVYFVCNIIFDRLKIHRSISAVFFLGGIGYVFMRLLYNYHIKRTQMLLNEGRVPLRFSFLTESFIPHVLLSALWIAIGNAYIGVCAVPLVALGFILGGFVTGFYKSDNQNIKLLFSVLSYFLAGFSVYLSYFGLSPIDVSNPIIFALTDIETLLGVVSGALLMVLCGAATYDIRSYNFTRKFGVSPNIADKTLLILLALVSTLLTGTLLGLMGLAGMGIGILVMSLQYQLFFILIAQQNVKIRDSQSSEDQFLPIAMNFSLLAMISAIIYLHEIFLNS